MVFPLTAAPPRRSSVNVAVAVQTVSVYTFAALTAVSVVGRGVTVAVFALSLEVP